MQTIRTFVLLSVALVISCGAESPRNSEPTGSAQSALLVPSVAPVPCRSRAAMTSATPHWAPPDSAADAEVIWDSSPIDLLAADALVQCSEKQKLFNGTLMNNLVDHDSYLRFAVVDKMSQAVPSGSLDQDSSCGQSNQLCLSPEERWKWVRTQPEYNCDPVTHEPGRPVPFKANGGVLERIPIEHFGFPENWSFGASATNSDLRTAGMNLCIAQYLRNASPGASSGQTLLLSDADQRWLLEVIRERSQIAMLQYALLGAVFSRNDFTTAENLDARQTVVFLGWYGNRCAAHDGLLPECQGNHLKQMGLDFATAVQLHVMVTEELAQLLGRSASANLQRGGSPETRADDIWGSQSWKQRVHALLFGGDPLAIEDDGPWQHPLRTAVPGAFGNGTWPDGNRVPYFHTSLAEPQVNELLALARRYDRIGILKEPTTCFAVNEPESSILLYDTVEANLRRDACTVQLPNGDCETDLTNLMPAATTPLADMLLWQRHRVTREHAATLIQHLTELLTYKGVGTCGSSAYGPDDYRMGPLNVVGEVLSASQLPAPQPGELQRPDVIIKPSATFDEPPIEDIAPKYTRFAELRIPDPGELVPLAESFRQGFSGCGNTGCLPGGVSANTEAKRLMGAVSAQEAVRRSILGSLEFLHANTNGTAAVGRLNDYFAQSAEMLKALGGSIGEEGFSVRPWVVATHDPNADLVDDVMVLTVATASGLRQMWNIQGTVAGGDEAFWNSDVYVCAIEDGLAGNLAAHPESTLFGSTVQSLMSPAGLNDLCGVVLPMPDFPGSPLRWGGYTLTRSLNTDGTFGQLAPTFVAFSRAARTFRLLGSQYKFMGSPTNVFQGQYIATGGQLGTYLRQQEAHREGDPVEPRYDGFGFRTDWVPPLSAELVGGVPGQESAQVFLQLAKESSSEATGAVEKAIDELIETEQDEVALAASASKAEEGIKEDKQALCGSSTVCPPSMKTQSLDPAWYPDAPAQPSGCSNNPPQTIEQSKLAVDCLVYEVFDGLKQLQVKIAQPVLDEITAPAVPAFSAYAGGSLQAAFIKQWGAIKSPNEKFKALVASAASVKAQIDVSHAVLQALQGQIAAECGVGGMLKSVASGISVGFPKGGSFSPGPALAKMEKCNELALQLGPAKKKVISAQMDAIAAMTSAVQGTIDAQVAIQLSSAEIDQLTNQASLADARNELEKKLASQTAKTSFGLVRRFRAYDLWRAKALVENARRYALAARRSIEARYVVNLSTLTKQEAFVSSPTTWADEVYAYDLSLPASVGLATGEAQPGGIYANKIHDYVNNLEGFVSGYAVSRPAAVAKDEIDVLDLPGMSSDAPYLVDTASTDECGDSPAATCVQQYGGRGDWSLHCALSDEWKELQPGQPASSVCGDASGEHVDRARLEFEMDPWGRVNRAISAEPFQKRFNGRWGPMAVNIVGTGVKDCDLAEDVLGCYSSAFVPYNLTHVGPAWVTDYDEIWRYLAVPSGHIEGGKAIAAELWLDPMKDGWSTSYISAVKRSELELRPLGGAYQLELAFGPEVQVDRIERIQLLVGSNYWVKQ